jgi:A/G-specific adenine glycosylase
MELGATVCTPQAPRCSQCPAARWCRARALGLAERLPPARRKNPAQAITVAAAVLLDSRGRTLLLREPSVNGALFSRLWQFPAVAARRSARQVLAGHLQRSVGLIAALQPLPPARHTVTFRSLRLLPFLVRVSRLPAVPGARTPRLAALGRLAVSSATRKIAAAALRAT